MIENSRRLLRVEGPHDCMLTSEKHAARRTGLNLVPLQYKNCDETEVAILPVETQRQRMRSRWLPPYDYTAKGLNVLRKSLKDMQQRGWVRSSTRPVEAPVLFVKLDGPLRLCLDFRGLNAIISKNRYPLTLN
jgi:hypothetical protein